MSNYFLNSRFDPTLLSRIEDAGLNASAPTQQRWLDGWLLRLSPGKAKRARCVNAVSLGRLPLAEKLVACLRTFEQAQLPLIVRITPFTQPPGLDKWLEGQGFASFDDTRVMVLQRPVDEAATLPPEVSIHQIGLEALAQRVGGFRGSPLAHRQAHAERLVNSPVPIVAFEAYAEGQPVACGQFALEGEFAGLYDIFTVEASRGLGIAGALCRRLLSEARDRGATIAYLQVEGDNHAARALYHRLGFEDGYAYHYRSRQAAIA